MQLKLKILNEKVNSEKVQTTYSCRNELECRWHYGELQRE